MNEQDRRAVENMCLTGMGLDGIYACFPSFGKECIPTDIGRGRKGYRNRVPLSFGGIRCG